MSAIIGMPPASATANAVEEPIKPAPPVIKIFFFESSVNFKSLTM